MRDISMILLSLSLVGGCVVYDEQLVYEDSGLAPGQEVEAPGDSGELPDDEDLIDALAYLEPSTGVLGSTVIVSLEGEIEAEEVVGVRFFGDTGLRISSSTVRDGTLLMSLELGGGCDGESGAAGMADLLVELQDGTAVFVEGAFEVLP